MQDEFYKKICDWLLPLDYTLIYSNHPASQYREYHFIFDKIRVCCVAGPEEYCYLHGDIFEHPHPLGITSGRYSIGTPDLKAIHQSIKKKIELIYANQ